MAATLSTGSPTPGKKSSGFVILDENEDDRKPMAMTSLSYEVKAAGSGPIPLQSGILANAQAKPNNLKLNTDNTYAHRAEDSTMDSILARMRELQVSSNQHSTACVPPPAADRSQIVMNKLIADLHAQKNKLSASKKEGSDSDGQKEEDRSEGSELFTPATDTFDEISPIDAKGGSVSTLGLAEMLRVRKELADAKSVITRQERELADSRNFKHTIDQAMGPSSEVDFTGRADINDRNIHPLPGSFNAAVRPIVNNRDSWHPNDDSRSENSDALSGESYGRGRGAWNGNTQPFYYGSLSQSVSQQPSLMDSRNANGVWPTVSSMPTNRGPIPNQRVLSGPSAPYGVEGRFTDEGPQFNPAGIRRTMSQYNRPSSSFNNRGAPFGGLGAGLSPWTPPPVTPMEFGGPLPYQPRPIGTPLSATASEFSTSSLSAWSTMSNAGGQTYVSPLEPMNYRRLLDRSVSCDWKYIVDKIVCSNDQQASIFLQQKLKLGTAEQKFDIVEAIVNQAYPLMINRFGNFLVQRCFEHGTPDQVIAIADAIHGNVLSLSMDAFGCHVIQKAFDSVPENHKADMVRELLRRIPDTVIHRYACHVWQKLFELRWSGEPPQIMLNVNEALRGMWHEVALGETGSLVVQNIFENCVEEEKRLAIEEVIASIDLIAHGQFGNWCIQHLCEHSSPPDKRRVVDHILANAYNYSIDQFASKVVEKCLKIGGPEFMERYLAVVTTAHPDRPRIPLIDISGDQYGNYLVQWILMNANHHQREQVASHIRKHMVSLRGSKFGSRVAMLCCNPSSVTRPGPGVIVNPFGAPGQPRGWGRYR